MKKFLPKLITSSSGFTLIELMVVIAIIGILSVIGFGVYNGVQGSARDTVRTTVVNQLAKNIESTKDPSTGKYTYTGTMFDADYPTANYPNGLTDPSDSATFYCIAMADTSAVAAPTSNPTNSSGTFVCPASNNGVATTTAAGGTVAYTQVKSGMTTVGPKDYFRVCSVRSERGSKPICQGPFTK